MQASRADPHLLALLRCAVEQVGEPRQGHPWMRPSLRSTHMLSSSKQTFVALTEELIPCSFDSIPVRPHNGLHFAKGTRIVSIIVGHMHLWI